MNSFLDKITVTRYLSVVNTSILSIHVILIVLFYRLHIMPMVYFNIGSVICYCICFFLVAKERLRGYVFVTFAEILLHTLMAVSYVGDNAGFQMYLLGSMSVVLFTHYFSVHTGRKPLNGPIFSAVCCVLYVVIIVYSKYHDPLYPLSFNEQFNLRVFNNLLAFLFIFTFFSLLTLIASRNEMELDRQAKHDNLTGLLNRHYLTRYMNSIQLTENLENYWVAIIDIDNFKDINDHYGHLCGDHILRSVSDIIREHCGGYTVCRWGGEEFLVLGASTDTEFCGLLERIRCSMEEQDFVYSDTHHHVTVTIGAAHYPKDQALDVWVNLADRRLYSGKQAGKNQVVSADVPSA